MKQPNIQQCADFMTWLVWAKFESNLPFCEIKEETYRRAREIGIDLDAPDDDEI